MAISLVKAGAVVTNGIPAFGQNTAAGNLLVALVVQAGTTVSAVSDGTWSEVAGARAAVTNSHSQIFYKENCGAAETAPTFTNAGFVILLEFSSGGAGLLSLAQAGAATEQASGGNVTAAGVDLTSANLVVTADFWRDNLTVANTTTDSYNNGATATNIANNDVGVVNGHYRFAYGVTTGNSAADKNTVTYTAVINHAVYSLASFSLVLKPTGIASGQAFGTASLRRLIAAVGIVSGAVVGAANSLLRLLAPPGAASGQTFGTANALRVNAPTGILSGETVSSADDVLRVLAAAGIGPGQIVASPALLRLLAPAGIGSRETFGAPALIRFVTATAIAPGGFGTPSAVRLIFPSAIAPAEAFGNPTVTGVSHFIPIDTNVLVSDKLLYAVQVSDALLVSVAVSDMLAESVVVSES